MSDTATGTEDDDGETTLASDATAAESGVTAPPPGAAYVVPDGEAAFRCPDCDRPFPEADLLALHRGTEHDERLDATDREAVADAREAEQRNLGLFRLRALVALVLLYFGLLMVYAVFT